MLEQLRRNSRSWLIWFIFAIIIAAFVLFFGPQSGPDMFGCGSSTSTAAEVDGEDIRMNSWRFAMMGLGLNRARPGTTAVGRQSLAIDILVERELLAQAAESAGFRVSDDMALKAIHRGEIYVGGIRRDGTQIYYVDNRFDYEVLERYAKQVLSLPSVDAFIDEQRREQLANATLQSFIGGAWVSAEEARAAYIHGNTKITASFLLFPVGEYARKLALTEADVGKYLAANEDAVKAAWEEEKAQFATDKERVLVRHLLIEKTAAPPAPAGEPDEPTPAAVPDPGKAAAEAALARIKGGEQFAVVAAEVSADKRTRSRGGLLGWRTATALGYGTAVVEAVKKLEVGGVSDVIESPRGFHVLALEARSETALGYDDRKLDVAFRLASTHYAKRVAEREANSALATAAGKPLADVFEAAPAPAPAAPGRPQLTPEQRRMIEEQIEKLKKEGAPTEDKSGVVFGVGEIRLAQSGGADTVSAAPVAAPATDEWLPEVEGDPPVVRRLGPLARPPEKLVGVGKSKELIAALFETLEEGQVADRVFEVTEPEGFAVIQLLDREEADLEQLDSSSKDIVGLLKAYKVIEAAHTWIIDRCRAAAEADEISVNPSVLTDDQNKPVGYAACSGISREWVGEQLATQRPDIARYLGAGR